MYIWMDVRDYALIAPQIHLLFQLDEHSCLIFIRYYFRPALRIKLSSIHEQEYVCSFMQTKFGANSHKFQL